MKSYYEQDGITIYHGDCLDVLPLLRGVDLVLTSPPYNLGTSTGGGMHSGSLCAADLAGGYGAYNDALSAADYAAWQRAAVAACWATLTDDGAIFYNHKPRPTDGVVDLPLRFGEGLPLRQIVIWDRGTGLNFSQSHLLPKSEWIVIWAKPSWRLVTRDACQIGDVWRVRPESDTIHPAPFPVELARLAIGCTSARLVVDPFAGSGTTLVAAKQLGRTAIGIEINERYCELSANRLRQSVLPFDWESRQPTQGALL